MGQLVEVTPDVTVEAPIQIGLGPLPLSAVLFGGALVSFAVSAFLPKGTGRTLAMIAGGGLAAVGVINLALPSAEATTPRRPDGDLPTAVPVTPGEVSDPLPEVTEQAFESVNARVVSPVPGTTIDLGFTSAKIPTRIRVENGSSQQAAFDLVLDINEDPNMGDPKTTQQTTRVTLGPNEARDIDLEVALVTWGGLTTQVAVTIIVGKQRLSGGAVELLDDSRFTVD
jgi:hypothetical protein